MQRFMIERNVASYVTRLRSEADAGARDILRRLLISEEDKFGHRSERLEIVERYIADCHSRIAQLHELEAKTDGRLPTPPVAAQTLANLRTLASLLEEHRDYLRKQLDDGGF